MKETSTKMPSGTSDRPESKPDDELTKLIGRQQHYQALIEQLTAEGKEEEAELFQQGLDELLASRKWLTETLSQLPLK